MSETSPGCILALDIGDRRIGIAMSDEDRARAFPVATMLRRNKREDLRYFDRLKSRRPFTLVLAGLPLYPSGDRSPQTEKAEAFANALADRFALPLVMWDERLSSAEAHRYLDATRKPGADRRDAIDQIAAVLILESWLARQANEKSRQQAGLGE